MNVLDASLRLYEWFGKSDSFSMEDDFQALVLVTIEKDNDKAAILCALESLEKYEIIKSAKKVDKVGDLIFRIDIQKKRRLYHLIYSKEGILKDKSKSKVFEYDGSEKNRKPSDGSHQMEPPRLPSM